MDILSPLFLLIFRALVVVLPLTTGWLAFRRVLFSRSPNAWLYAMTCLFSAVTVAGLLPWALGLANVSWIFFLFSAFCPAVWVIVVMLCDMSRSRASSYEPDLVVGAVAKLTSKQKPSPLVLENPDWPGAPMPVFRHNKPANLPKQIAANAEIKSAEKAAETTKTVLSIAREMRRNKDSDARRPKLLPPPDVAQLPFLNRG